jgi:hypothetical protein
VQDRRKSEKEDEPVVGRECNQTLSRLLDSTCFSPILTQITDTKFDISQSKGMGQPLSQRERFIAPLESLVGIAELPQSESRVAQAHCSGIKPEIAEGERRMALRVIDGDRQFKMLLRAKCLSNPKRVDS